MAEQPPSDQKPDNSPKLPNLVEASKLTLGQKTQNFLGFGYGLNTVISVTFVNFLRKTFGSQIEKWENRIATKFVEKSIKRELGESYDKLSAEDKATVDARYQKRGETYAKKKVEGYLLSFGGFAVLPGQSALENLHYGQNILKPIDRFREDAKAHIDAQTKNGKSIGDMAEEWLGNRSTTTKEDLAEALLDKQIHEQMDKTTSKSDRELLKNAKVPPKYNLTGDATKQGLPRWIFGRVTALVAAYTTQSVVESIAGDKKDKVDMVLAKIFTKIMHPQGYSQSPEAKQLFNDLGIEGEAPEGVDPKVLKTVRMFTTDGYMTTAALLTHNVMNEGVKNWEKKQDERKAKAAKAASPTP